LKTSGKDSILYLQLYSFFYYYNSVYSEKLHRAVVRQPPAE